MSLWLSKNVVRAVQERLTQGPNGSIAVVDFPQMGKALRQAGRDLIELPRESETTLAAVIIDGLGKRQEWSEELGRLRAQLQPGGQLLCIDKNEPAEISRRLLCAGLSDLRQRLVGRRLLTSAIVPLR